MQPYDESQVVAFIDDATAIYRAAGRSPDPHALIWVARMQFDAETIGYAASRAKHLDELRAALDLAPAPRPTPFDPTVRQPWPRPMPPDIDTTDVLEVTDRVDWALMFFRCSDDRSGWVGYVMDFAGEGHVKGWTADGYWRLRKIAFADGVGKGYQWPPN